MSTLESLGLAALRKIDPDCPLDHVVGEPRDAGARSALTISLGMGGQNAALLLERAEA